MDRFVLPCKYHHVLYFYFTCINIRNLVIVSRQLVRDNRFKPVNVYRIGSLISGNQYYFPIIILIIILCLAIYLWICIEILMYYFVVIF